MYGNGRPEPDGQRREDGEDLAAEALLERLALLVADVLARDDPDAVLRERGQQLLAQAAACGARPGRGRARGSRRRPPSACGRPRPGRVSPASIWSSTPATRTMKNSSRFEVQIAVNFTRSISGTPSPSASWSTRSLKSSHESSRFA